MRAAADCRLSNRGPEEIPVEHHCLHIEFRLASSDTDKFHIFGGSVPGVRKKWSQKEISNQKTRSVRQTNAPVHNT
eukprot:scaffold68127_cov16-Tisochrysis_lutea.AAC.1